jgi:hypothetical protein
VALAPDALSRAGLSPDAQVHSLITRWVLEAELPLCPLERRGRLIPFAAVLATIRWLGTERGVAVGNIVVKPKAGDRGRRPIPRLGAPSAPGPLTQSADQPFWPAVDHPAGESVAQAVVLASHLLDRVLDAVAFGPDLVGVAQLTL